MKENITVSAIVLRTAEYKEADRILTLYSIESGKISCSARGVRREKAKLKSATTPMAFCEYSLCPSKAGYTLTDAKVIDSFFDITKDYDKYLLACACIELVDKFGTEESDPNLFLLLVNTLKSLCYEADDLHDLAVDFMRDFLVVTGFLKQDSKQLSVLARQVLDAAERVLPAFSTALSNLQSSLK